MPHIHPVNRPQFFIKAQEQQILNRLDLRKYVFHFFLVDVVVFKQNPEQFELKIQKHLEVKFGLDFLEIFAEMSFDHGS